MISWFDIKKSILFLVKDYKYSLVVIASLAFSLGITLFLFAQIYTVEFRPLEFSQPEEIISITRKENGYGYKTGGIYYFDFLYFRDRQSSFEALARYEDRLATLETDRVSERVQGAAVNAELFEVADTQPLLGRTLQPADNEHGSAQVAVIGYDLWHRLFDGSPDVLGETVKLNGLLYNIVGVMPEGFYFPINHEIWVGYPMWNMPNAETIGWNTLIGRLKDDVTIEQARAEFESMAGELRAIYPDYFKGKYVHVVPYTKVFSEGMSTILGIMSVVGIAILLMGCFSVSNLLIVRMLENEREGTIKSALGLPAWRIATKPLLESFWLCFIAGLLAVFLCFVGISLLGNFMYSDGPYWWSLQFDYTIVLAGAIFVLLMWLGTGVVPVILAMRTPTNSALSSGRKGGAVGKSGPIMNLLIGVQIICAFVLMVLTGLSVEALYRTLSSEYGVDMENKMVADVRLSEFSHPGLQDRLDYYERLGQEIASVPGVNAVAFTSGLAGFSSYSKTYLPPGATSASGDSYDRLFEVSVSENLFDTLDVRLLKGRIFNRYDNEESSLVTIVDERTAKMLDPAGDVVGQQIQIDVENKGPLVTIVGVVSTVLHGSPMTEEGGILGVMYQPMRQLLPAWGTMQVVVDSEGNPAQLAHEIKQAGRRVDPQIAIAAIMTYEERLSQSTRQLLSMVYNFLPAALLAFLMASVGIYGIATRVTMQKANDLGIMKAIGATDSNVLWTFLKKTWVLLAASFSAGLLVLVVILPTVSSGNFVFTIAALSLIVAFVLALVFLMVTAASLIPVSRINRLSPQAALNFRLGA